MLTIREPMFILDKEGNPVAAVVDIDSYNVLLDALEELNDLAAIDLQRESGEIDNAIPWEQAKAELDQGRQQKAG
jgi:hypothetical protein